MKRKKLFCRILAMLLICIMILVGCTKNKPLNNTGSMDQEESLNRSETAADQQQDMISVESLASSVREKYSEQEKIIYTDPLYDLDRDHIFEVDLGFNPLDKDIEYFYEIIGFYADPEFTQSAQAAFDIEDHEDGTYTMQLKPGRTPSAVVSTTMYDNGTSKTLGDGYYLFDRNEYMDWGNLGQYYMVQWLDLKTGDALEKPIVTLFTVEHQLDSPQVDFYITENGTPGFKWSKVDGAQKYFILEINASNGRIGTAYPIAQTSETSWEYDNEYADYSMNSSFRMSYSERAYNRNQNENEQDLETGNVGEQESETSEEEESVLIEKYYGVIAVTEEECSAVSQIYSQKSIAYRLPYTPDQETIQEEGEYKRNIEAVGLLPAQIPLEMCDGSIVRRTLTYDLEAVQVKEETWYTYDEDEDGNMINVQPEQVTILQVPYTIDGTTFRDVFRIENFNSETYEEELKQVENRQNELKGRSSSESGTTIKAEETAGTETASEIISTGDRIFANSALSEYLAVNMLAGNKRIDLSEFPEGADVQLLADAWGEAIYQNPLILGARDASISVSQNALIVDYDDELNIMLKKQQEIREEVKRIVNEIITPEMTDIEKEFVINDYLCEWGEYDQEALENAQQNNYMSIDKQYRDSFTPYGILAKKKGVCASYAGAFKLLADEAGLECIVVTGYLEGSLAHTWNRVKLDVEWKTIDVSNNDNPYLFNALLNVPDDVAGLVLMEDDRFVMNEYLDSYKAGDGEKEYYRVIDKYFSIEDITKQLVQDLKNEGAVTLRTEYDLDEQTFQTIAGNVMEQLGMDNLFGFHWMGVISLSIK